MSTANAHGPGDTGAADVLRPHAEEQYASELAAIAALDTRERPPGWRLSPWAVVRYVLRHRWAVGYVWRGAELGGAKTVEVK